MVGKILRPAIFIIGIGLISIFVVFWIASMVLLFVGLPLSGFVHPDSSLTTFLSVLNILSIIGIPLMALIMLIMRVFLRSHFRPKWQFGLWAFWFINVVSLALVGASTAKDFSSKNDVNLGSSLYSIKPDTILIEMEESPFEDTWLQIGDELIISDNQLISKNIRIYIEKSETGKFEIIQKNSSRGNGFAESQELANSIEYTYQVEGNKVILPSYFTIKNGKKWRNQCVRLYLKIPEGKYVQRSRIVREYVYEIDRDENYKFPSSWDNKQIWQMGINGLLAPDYISERKQEFLFDNFSKIRLEGNIKLNIKQGDRYRIDMTKGSDYYDDIEVSQADDRLNISTDADPNETILIDITVPGLDEIWAINSDDIEIRDFKLDNLHIVNEGEAQIKVFADIKNLNLQLTGDNELDLRGIGEILTAILSDDAELDAEHFTVKNATIELANDSRAKVSATDTLWQKINQSELISRHNPVVIEN